jgi:acetate kinase
MMVLLLNAGSSGLKFSLIEADTAAVRAQGMADWAGPTTRYRFEVADKRHGEEVPWRRQADAVRRCLADLVATGVVARRSDIAAVGHRVVHGGDFTSVVRVTPEVRAKLAALAELAPLHNPPSLEALAAAEEELPSVPHIAVFDTAFHATMRVEARLYPVPQAWTQDWGIRRYGFHGLSHAYCAERAAEKFGRRASRLVICHLGHGCSATAVRDGRSIDTTMGFTPLEGLMMATRSGSLDPGAVLHVLERHRLSPEEVDAALNRQSGLLGVSGLSADMRVVLEASAKGHEPARLAVTLYCHRVRQAIGALAVTLGGIDALIFTAGVGENAADIRGEICRGLECLGLHLDPTLNISNRPDTDIATVDSPARILVIATREDVMMLREVRQVVG